LLKKSHKLIFYLSSAVIKIKGFTEIIRDPARFILDFKATYKAIKKIKWSERLIKEKKTTISKVKRFFEVLKNISFKVKKAFNTSGKILLNLV